MPPVAVTTTVRPASARPQGPRGSVEYSAVLSVASWQVLMGSAASTEPLFHSRRNHGTTTNASLLAQKPSIFIV
jgi:hypothetical protein